MNLLVNLNLLESRWRLMISNLFSTPWTMTTAAKSISSNFVWSIPTNTRTYIGPSKNSKSKDSKSKIGNLATICLILRPSRFFLQWYNHRKNHHFPRTGGNLFKSNKWGKIRRLLHTILNVIQVQHQKMPICKVLTMIFSLVHIWTKEDPTAKKKKNHF